jgi:thioredoxin reductase/Pyruvate/2-oxoacid:ferredoxin oxidoreductase delta subunit
MTSDAAPRALLAASQLVLLYAALLAPVLGWHLWSRRRVHRRAVRARDAARSAGLTEPASLHPVIEPSRCLGCGACVTACPEGDVLGLVHGRAELVNPTHCIGHGACETACPFDAITLVLGTARRGVEIPRVGPDFETRVPGVYVAGELGGMGLIRNAVEQGRQVIDSVRRRRVARSRDALDVLIIGAGPAGLSASLAAKQHGLRAVTIEQETLGGTVAHYPRGKLVMTRPWELPLHGKVSLRETTKEELLSLWEEVVGGSGIDVRYQETAEAVASAGGVFEVKTSRGVHRARSLVLAIGRRGTPAKLGVPGEDAPHVVYRLEDPEQYRRQRVLVVGGGDSALEAALAVADAGAASVAICYRGEAFTRAKPANRARLEAALRERRAEAHLGARVSEIRRDAVTLEAGGCERVVSADAVIVCVGGVLPTVFLQSIGIELETLHGAPLH